MDVLLGVCDSSCPDLTASPFINKLGGIPDFFPTVSLAAPPTCSGCGLDMALLVQMYCPLETSPYHRTFHVYCCCSLACMKTNSWVVLRSQELEKTEEQPKPAEKLPLPTQDWCEDANDWTESNSDISTTILSSQSDTQILEETSVVDVTSNLTKMKLNPYTGPYYPSSFINVFAEKDIFYKRTTSIQSDTTHSDLSNDNTDNSQCEAGFTVEEYEQSIVSHGDKTFMKFKKQIDKCPNQIVRYQKNGKPLLSSDNNVPCAPVTCSTCGNPSSFEFQIMPQLVYILQQSMGQSSGSLDDDGTCLTNGSELTVPEFGTVLVYTCDNSCWDGSQCGFREEVIFVQPELT